MTAHRPSAKKNNLKALGRMDFLEANIRKIIPEE